MYKNPVETIEYKELINHFNYIKKESIKTLLEKRIKENNQKDFSNKQNV